jgi:hypothetical protein
MRHETPDGSDAPKVMNVWELGVGGYQGRVAPRRTWFENQKVNTMPQRDNQSLSRTRLRVALTSQV